MLLLLLIVISKELLSVVFPANQPGSQVQHLIASH